MQRFQNMAVWSKTVGPIVRAHQRACFFVLGNVPRKAHAEHIGIVDFAETEIFGIAESFVKGLRNPWMFFVKRRADSYHVHDRKNAGAPKIVLLDPLEVSKQAPHARDPAHKA